MTRTIVLTVAMLVAVVGAGPAFAQAEQDEVVYFHLDAVGSVRAVTDETGQEVARLDYLPFGEAWPSQNSQETRQFTGAERDQDTGFDYLGARYHSGLNGRFTTADDPSYIDPFNPQSMNLYAYGLNNPLRWRDTTGHDPECLSDYCETVVVVAPRPPDIGLPPVGALDFVWNSFTRTLAGAATAAQPVVDWWNAPRDAACLAAATNTGASIGAVTGGAIGAFGGTAGGATGGTVAAPGVGTIGLGLAGGTAGFAKGTAIGAVAGGALGAAVGSVKCMSSSAGGGGNNQQQNRQFREAVKQIEKAIGKKLRPDQIDQLHREISKQNYTLEEIVQLGIAMFR